MILSILRGSILTLILAGLVGRSPVFAATPIAEMLRCTAFEPSRQTIRAEIVYNRALEHAEQIGLHEPDELQTAIVRASVKEIVGRSDWSQREKAVFWRAIVELLRVRSGYYFISDEFAGSDGSIVFQGGQAGTALVITSTGEVYRGSLKSTLDERQNPRPVWKANYINFVLVSRPITIQNEPSVTSSVPAN